MTAVETAKAWVVKIYRFIIDCSKRVNGHYCPSNDRKTTTSSG